MASNTRRMLLELDPRWTDEKIEGSTSVRRFKDSIHDYLPFGPTICAIIDTPQFQRLRNIKQLGTSYYVWPGASHNRFEHCLGVAYLAQTLAIHLKDSQPSLRITQRDVQCVTIAGLCHDLGHGPWSHVWDSMFIPAVMPDKKWCHEDASRMMFDALLEENDLYLAPEDAAFVKALIMGDTSMCIFDYIARDSHAIDQKSNLSLTRLIYSSRVIDDEICYDIKDALQIFELCHTRMSLHKRIYTHKTAKAVEYMIVDALTKAEPVMHIAHRLENPKEYLYLTDYIQTEIEASKDPRLAEAQAIMHRIRVRDLYSSVDFKVFPWHCKSKLKEVFTPERVVNGFRRLYEQSKRTDASAKLKDLFKDVGEEDAMALGPEHVIIDLTAMHHGMQDLNPLDFVKFYSKHNPDKGITANPDDVSVTLPSAFGEIKLRVYTRESRFFGLVQLGYREVLRNFQIPPPPPSREPTEPAEEHDSGSIDLPLELDPEPVDPLTPPADTPTASSSPVALASGRGRAAGPFGRAVSMGMAALGTRARAPVGRSKSAMLDRSVVAGRAVDNQFTTVAPTYKPRSPTRAAKGVKREREDEGGGEGEVEGERKEVRVEVTGVVAAEEGEAGTQKGKEREEDSELDLELDRDFEADGERGESKIRGRKRTKV
ncbi:hypothetical protein BN946_scf185011.g38 [Trametes cinnabarina]|uniref:HD/PDEase domain-containing protein n=1 Tax=Pycnoporus cinnabarinus TaxID=5643 RepID=A0A060SVZ5_PYCCI|nr:hypothetical protein BN946_scf185011.g38 [Trametes cinnabarina]